MATFSSIRHPMYLGFLVMLLITPIVLGSWWAEPVFLIYIPIIMWRIGGKEEAHRDLPGYDACCRKIPHRLLPFVR